MQGGWAGELREGGDRGKIINFKKDDKTICIVSMAYFCDR